MQCGNYYCVCGSAMFPHGRPWDGTMYLTCTAPYCRQYNIPVKMPTVAAEAADPRIVRAIQQEERSNHEPPRVAS